MAGKHIQEKSRSPPQWNAYHRTQLQTVSFLSIVILIDRKKQSTRGMGIVAPHRNNNYQKKEKR